MSPSLGASLSGDAVLSREREGEGALNYTHIPTSCPILESFPFLNSGRAPECEIMHGSKQEKRISVLAMLEI